jgi:tetratricopeptide (TPR) repeat protein
MDRITRESLGVMWATLALLLAVGLGGKLSASESAAAAGSGATSSASVETTNRSPAADALLEMPLAESISSSTATTPDADPQVAKTSQQAADQQSSPIQTLEPVEERSGQLEQVAQQADRRTRHGCELAGRGACFAARSEFIGALRLVAEGLDAEQKTNLHGRALAAALSAIREADDFVPGGSRLEADLNLPAIIAAHVTPVLKDSSDAVTSMTALQCYFTFAQQQFAAAAGHEVAGSMALHAIGKLHAAMAEKKSTTIVAAESKAMTFYQAAMLAYPANHLAANDLGVLLARCGRYSEAQEMLQRSVSLCPQSTAWWNLSVVHRQLGQPVPAMQAATEAELSRKVELSRRQQQPGGGNEFVRWVDSQAFAQTSLNTPTSPGAITPPPARTAGRPSEYNRAAAAGWPTATVSRPQQQWTPGTTWPGTPARPMPNAYGPAPTPAAAERLLWGTQGYQR